MWLFKDLRVEKVEKEKIAFLCLEIDFYGIDPQFTVTPCIALRYKYWTAKSLVLL